MRDLHGDLFWSVGKVRHVHEHRPYHAGVGHPPTRTLSDLLDEIAARDPARELIGGRRDDPIGTGTVQKERDAAGA